MIKIKSTLAAVLLAVGIHTQVAAAPAATPAASNPEQTRLAAARKAAQDLPEVASAEQQAKVDRALATKAYAEYKTARQRSNESEATYKKAFEAALVKVDPGAPALQEKERAAFRDRMQKARESKKSGSSKSKGDEDDDDKEDKK